MISLKKIDLNGIKASFKNLDARSPEKWPVVPRVLMLVAITACCILAVWFAVLSSTKDELTEAQVKEQKLKIDFKKKLAKAVDLPALKRMQVELGEIVTQLEKQLPSKSEMDALLADINNAGLGRGLQFELFKPNAVIVKDYYAELPISIKITGKYHEIGAFASDIAHLSRIVTLNNLSLTPVKDSQSISMESVANTYRYLDPDEVKAQMDAKAKLLEKENEKKAPKKNRKKG